MRRSCGVSAASLRRLCGAFALLTRTIGRLSQGFFHTFCTEFSTVRPDFSRIHELFFQGTPLSPVTAHHPGDAQVVIRHIAVATVQQIEQAVVGAALFHAELQHAGQRAIGITFVEFHGRPVGLLSG